MTPLWQSPEDRERLLKRLVQHQSVTLSEGEVSFPYLVKDLLLQSDYFHQHPHHIHLHPTGDGRHSVIAMYKGSDQSDTITLISHYDTVGIEDFSTYQHIACDMDLITERFRNDQQFMDGSSLKDLLSNDYLFGRGSMDMKPGLMLHMSLVEKAAIENWNINLIIVTVPDEEVNSLGMRTAVELLKTLKDQHSLNYVLHLNSEPTFQQSSLDNAHYVYSGSIGKIMPAVYCYGKETHVGTPMSGISSNLMLSFIHQKLEFNRIFKEQFKNEHTPLPVSLMNKDLKTHYDVQTPFRSVALYNVFLFDQSAEQVMDKFHGLVQEQVIELTKHYKQIMTDEQVDYAVHFNVMTYSELYDYAVEHYGAQRIESIINQCIEEESELYKQSIHITDTIMNLCKTLGPTIITFFVPPYYPAVNASGHELIELLTEVCKETLSSKFNRTSKRIHYFNGISDLSYAQYEADKKNDDVYVRNTPNFKRTYEISFDAIEAISAPVFNCGPIGKDAHKVTERINKVSAFEELPAALEAIVKHIMN